MKVLALFDAFFIRQRPSFWLGFSIISALVILICFLAYTFYQSWFCGIKSHISNWPAVIGIPSAILGWMVTAWVNLRNSIKQHTFNFWLQTRCSAKYMEHAEAVNLRYFSRAEKPHLQLEDIATDDFKKLESSFIYVLNHYEFIAVGIRSGDLDEDIIKQSMKGIVTGLFEYTRIYIQQLQQQRPQAYEYLTALYHRWK